MFDHKLSKSCAKEYKAHTNREWTKWNANANEVEANDFNLNNKSSSVLEDGGECFQDETKTNKREREIHNQSDEQQEMEKKAKQLKDTLSVEHPDKNDNIILVIPHDTSTCDQDTLTFLYGDEDSNYTINSCDF